MSKAHSVFPQKEPRGVESVTASLRQAHDRAFRADPLQILGVAALDRFRPLEADRSAFPVAHLDPVIRGIKALVPVRSGNASIEG
jgi:hypothetical protein